MDKVKEYLKKLAQWFWASPYKARAWMAIAGAVTQGLHSLGFDTGLTPSLQNTIVESLDAAMWLLLLMPGQKGNTPVSEPKSDLSSQM